MALFRNVAVLALYVISMGVYSTAIAQEQETVRAAFGEPVLGDPDEVVLNNSLLDGANLGDNRETYGGIKYKRDFVFMKKILEPKAQELCKSNQKSHSDNVGRVANPTGPE